jgi:hypothetical protein
MVGREPPGRLRCKEGMKRIVALLAAVFSMFAVLAPSTAHAGGWAVASLDPLGPVRAGEQIDVGFVLLQHGRTPVVATEWPGATVGLAVRAGGEEWFVPATMQGDPGHYVATVAVPDGVETIALNVQMPNGLVVEPTWADVAVQASSPAGGDDGWVPTWTVPLLALLAAACAATLLVDMRSARRRRRELGAAGTTPA